MKRVLMVVCLTLGLVTLMPRSIAQGVASQAGYLYLSPVPGASYIPTQNRYILVRLIGVTPSQVANLASGFITVNGNVSGNHQGFTRVATDGRTVIFDMDADFSLYEIVTVSLNPLLAPATSGALAPYSYQFRIEAPMPGSTPLTVSTGSIPARIAGSATVRAQPNLGTLKSTLKVSRTATAGRVRPKATIMSNGVSVPSDFPQVFISVNGHPSPGYLFLENALDDVPPYTMILDNNGLPIWYQQGRMYDFKLQKNGTMTWCLGNGVGFQAFDQNLNYLRTYVTTNGYQTDGHDLKIQPDGRYFMIGFQNTTVDMSQYIQGGVPGETVTETVVQEFTAADELILQWRAWDNYDIRDLQPLGNTDFVHINGVDIDDDGNLLISARHLSEVTKVDVDSGQIIWRLSGAHSSFTFTNDPLSGTSYQHNISALGGGRYLVFDNGDLRSLQVSRAAEFQLDLTNMTASLVWQYRDNPDKYAWWMGSAQRLPSGNTLIDFVMQDYPKAIEVDSNGVKQFELSLVPGSESYRAFRFPWNGVVAAPYLIVEQQPDSLSLLFNKFGDRNVAYYRIYGGLTPQPTNLLAESSTTLAQLSNLPNGVYYFRVTSVSKNGVESAFSNEANITVNNIRPGQNLVQNGNFSQGLIPWQFFLQNGATASWEFLTNGMHFQITNAGPALASIQLLQGGIPLVQGNQYILEFDAWSSQTRYIQVDLAQAYQPYLDYSLFSPAFLTPNRTHYRYTFTMQQPSDFQANLLFNLGTSTADVFLANAILFTPPVGDFNADGRVDFLDLSAFCGNWLKTPSSSPMDFNCDGIINFIDFNILGQNWANPGP